eukprot:scaffold34770_cov81-Phaeocystis_antarctica.AAC.1
MQIGGRAWGGAHPEHHAHVCDFGGVEAQRLVERRRVLPSRKQGIRWVRGELRAGRREAAGDGGASSVCRSGLDYRFEAGDGEERTWNMDCIFVTLEPAESRKEGMYGAGRRAGREVGRGEQPWCKQRAGESSTADWGYGTGRAHPEHGMHVRDARGVEAQRLVERGHALPRFGRRAYGAGPGAGLEVGGGGRRRGARSAQGSARLQFGGRARGGGHQEHARGLDS